MQAKPPSAAQQMLLQYLSTGLALPAASAAGILKITESHQSSVYSKTLDQQCSGVFYAFRKINWLALSLAQRFIERYFGCSIVGVLGCRVCACIQVHNALGSRLKSNCLSFYCVIQLVQLFLECLLSFKCDVFIVFKTYFSVK